ncbi:hypothetical protein BRC96_08545 [Halobacteriales archaeon QS_6_64_34]|nr:MAG: hypothetical protein BRC96_08545 [Halobacteriales archaeon QS_6_64_34]
MKLPQGRLRKSRVVTDPREPLADVLDRAVTGYAVFEPQDSLLLDADGRGVVTFVDGVPVVAYHTGTDRGGPPALADLAVPGPYHVSVFELDGADLGPVHDVEDLRVPPGMPAERLAGDPALADSTRRAAPPERRAPAGTEAADDHGAVEAFLEDEEKIEAIREQARQEAKQRAAEWELNDT